MHLGVEDKIKKKALQRGVQAGPAQQRATRRGTPINRHRAAGQKSQKTVARGQLRKIEGAIELIADVNAETGVFRSLREKRIVLEAD